MRRALSLLALIGTLLVSVAAAPASAARPAPSPVQPSPAPPAASPAPPPTPARPAATAVPAPTPSATPAPPPTIYFNWFDKASPGMTNDNIHLVNPNPAPVSGTVRLGSATVPFKLDPGAGTYVTFPFGTIGGPVAVDASATVVAAQRVTYFRSFSEVAGMAGPGVTDGWWPWYDLASPGMLGDNVHLLNPDPVNPANVTLTLAGLTTSVRVGPGQETWAAFAPGTIGGPLHFVSDRPVLAAQRVQTQTSFNELPVLATAAAALVLNSNWYDNASPGFAADNLHIVNTEATDAHVALTLAGSPLGTLLVPHLGELHVSLPVGTIGGPLKLVSDRKIVATQRVSYYDAFQEVAFQSTPVSDVWFSWYDDASPCFLADNVHLLNAGPAPVAGSMSMPGQTAVPFSIDPGKEAILNWPRGTIGGPVHVSVSTPGGAVIPDKRVVICPPPPPPPPPSLRKIVVSLSQQHLWAYDGGNLFLETDVTTGRPELPTPGGQYHIFYKTSPYQMISPWPYGSPYWYPTAWVNWVLEFLQGGYFLHDAPWRSWFGPGSQYGDGTHGCVNIPNAPMIALYNWAQLGDEVDING